MLCVVPDSKIPVSGVPGEVEDQVNDPPAGDHLTVDDASPGHGSGSLEVVTEPG